MPSIQSRPAQFGVLRLEDLATAKAQAILHGESLLESRSHSLTYALREVYGWENWAVENGVPISGDAEALARDAGAALGIDAERIRRIILSLPDPNTCVPATVFAGGEISAWKRIWKINREAYHAYCPDEIQQSIQESIQRNCHKILQFAGYSVAPRQNDRTQAWQTETVSYPSREVLEQQTDLDMPLKIPDHLGRPDTLEQIPGWGKQQLQTFVRNAGYILSYSPQVLVKATDDFCQGNIAGQKRVVHGRIYYLEVEGLQLTIQAKDRGTIFRMIEDRVERATLTVSDLHCFQAEVNRLKQQQIAGSTTLTHSRTLGM